MIDKSFIEKIESMAINNCDIKEVDGVMFTPAELHPVRVKASFPTLKLHSLSGLVDYIKANKDEVKMQDSMLIVESFQGVSLVTRQEGKFMERLYVATSTPVETEKFRFGNWMDTEQFIIQLRSRFEDGEDMEKVVSYASRVVVGETVETEDDGVGQTTVTKKNGSGTVKAKETAPAVVYLRPYRTFPELDQVCSPFLLRMRNEDNKASFALFEADGGSWQNLAMNKIKEMLQKQLPQMTILA